MAKSKKPKSAIAHLVLTPTNALRIVRRLAQDSKTVFFSDHASKRMTQRKVTRVQVLECLLKGAITEGPALDIKACWKFTITRVACGDTVSAVVALDWDAEKASYIIIVTVIRD